MISIAPGDFDADGKPDLAVCYLSGDIAVLIGTGANGFIAGSWDQGIFWSRSAEIYSPPAEVGPPS